MITSDLYNNKKTALFENTGPVTHRIGLTVTDPNHPMVSKRGETIQKTVRVKGDDREKAINGAIAHLRRKGYKVHDHHYIGTVDQGVAEGQLELNTPDPVVVVQDQQGKILDKINLSVAAQKYKLGQPQNIKNQLAHQNYTKIGSYTIVSPMSGQPQDQTTTGQKTTFATPGVVEGKKPDSYHIVNKDGKPATLASYADKASAEKDRDAKHPGAEVRQLGPRGKIKNVSEVTLGDYPKKAQLSQAGAKINKFFDRDDPAAVAAANQTIAKREKGLARADARRKPYTPPKFDAEKHQRDLTAKYPNIDELVAKAEQRRDPDYNYAEGDAYYAGREAEQNYQRLKQIQRVIQGLNESQIKENKMKLKEAILIEDPIYRTWKTLGQTLVERRMSEKEILQVFADAEAGMTDKATGSNRTMLGRGKDTTMDFAGQVKDAVSGVLNSIQNSVPVAAVDVAYDQATDALSKLSGGQKGKVMQAIKGYRNLVKQYPKTAGFAKAALVAIAGLATGGAGLPAVAGLTYALDSSIRGDKLSSVMGKGAGAAFMTWLATQMGSANAADTKPVGPGYHDPVYDAPNMTPDLATYTAKSGDTLSQIAKDNGTTVRDIVGLNPQLAAASGAKAGQVANPDVLFPGQEITLPAASGENIYSGGWGTQSHTLNQIGSGNMPNSAVTQRLAMRESLKFVTLPVDQLIDRELTVMSWVVNESVYNIKHRGVWLTQAGTYAVFENIDRYRLSLMEKAGVPGSTRPEYYRPDMPDGPGKATKPGMIGRGLNWLDQKAKAVGGALSNFGHQFTTDVTKEKLKMNWHQSGKPSDSDQLAAWLVTQGVPQQVVAGVFKKMSIPYTPPQAAATTAPTTATVPTTAPTTAPQASAARPPGEDPKGANYVGRREVARRQAARAAGPQPTTTSTPNFGQQTAPYKYNAPATKAATASTAPPAPKIPKTATTDQQQQEYYRALGLAENLEWSPTFNPGHSLYRQMKKES